MTVAVATLGCTRKIKDLHSWPSLTSLDGDYRLYINYELQSASDCYMPAPEWDVLDKQVSELRKLNTVLRMDVDTWRWQEFTGSTAWRNRPRFDQDQARLASIVTARNMCIEYALQTDCSHLLFIDADIIPQRDIIPKMLEVESDAVCGMVYGRGVHSNCPYIFGEKRRWKTQHGFELIELEHGNIGFTMLSRRLFSQVRFRYGVSEYPDGRHYMISDDPAYHLDCFIKFGQWPVLRTDVVGSHVGDLAQNETSQF